MALTQKQVSELYVAIFNRASDIGLASPCRRTLPSAINTFVLAVLGRCSRAEAAQGPATYSASGNSVPYELYCQGD